MIPVAQMVGSNRLVKGTSIVYPLGDPNLPLEQERALRKQLVVNALEALQTNIKQQTVFNL